MPITRLADSGNAAGPVGFIDVTRVGSGPLITAIRTASNRLKLISWKCDSGGGIARLKDSGNDGSLIKSVACPRDSEPGHILTTLRQDDKMALKEWSCDPTSGALSIVTSGVWGPSAIAMGASAGIGQTYVTIARDKMGVTQLASWKRGGLAHLGEAKAGAVSGLCRPLLADVLMTPVIEDCAERMKLIAWTPHSDGTLTRSGDSGNAAGTVSRIACTHIGGKWATAVRDGNGRLKVIFWEMADGGPKRIGDSGSSGLEITEVDTEGLDFSDVAFGSAEAEWRVVTAVRAKNGRLRLAVWAWKQATGKVVLVEQTGDQPEPISLLRMTEVTNHQFVTVVRDDSTKTDTTSGHLKLITWKID